MVVHRARRAKKSSKGSPPYLTSNHDSCFNAVGAYPFMANHLPDNKIFRVVSTATNLAAFTSSSTVNAYYAASFSVSSLPTTAISAALTLYDQYRIELIETWLVARDPSGVNNSNPGVLTTAIDLDDSVTPTNPDTVQSYTTSLTSSGTSGHYHRWRPHAALAAYSGVFTSFANMESPWIDSGSNGVQHYGLKVAITPTGSAVAYDLIYRVTVAFRSQF
jgi:hypothetical protein